MKLPKLTKLELQIMEMLWTRGPCAIREIQEAFPKRNRPAYSTIQTTVYRLEGKKTLRRVKKINFCVFREIMNQTSICFRRFSRFSAALYRAEKSAIWFSISMILPHPLQCARIPETSPGRAAAQIAGARCVSSRR